MKKEDNNMLMIDTLDEQSSKLLVWEKIFGGDLPALTDNEDMGNSILDEEVESELAQECISAFEDLMKNGGTFSVIQRAYTQSVSFGTVALGNWLQKNQHQSNFNKLSVCFGIYTKRMVEAHHLPVDYEGRLTVFLWPHKDDTIATIMDEVSNTTSNAPPFNLGDLKP